LIIISSGQGSIYSQENKNIAPSNEMKPIIPFGAWAYVFCFFNIIFDQLKEPAGGRKKFA